MEISLTEQKKIRSMMRTMKTVMNADDSDDDDTDVENESAGDDADHHPTGRNQRAQDHIQKNDC